LSIVNSIESAMDMFETKVTWTDIANVAGVSKGTISGFKAGKELNFNSLWSIARYFSNKMKKDLLKDWCTYLNKPQNIKHAFEFLALNHYINQLETLIKKVRKEQTNRIILDFADAYEILLMHLKNEEIADIFTRVRKYRPKSEETEVLAALIKIYALDRNREYKTIKSLMNGIEKSINNIEDDYIKSCYKIRLMELESRILLFHENNPEKAREVASKIIFSEIGARLVSQSYYIIGMSFLYSDYDKCISNILKYREMNYDIGRHDHVELIDNHDIPFIKNYWSKYLHRPETSDISEIAHYEARKGNSGESLTLLEKAIEVDGESGFKLYYKGLATNDPNDFMESLIMFVKKGDKFFAQLPYERLKKNAIYKKLADRLLN
jgi:transcriptional regulator with XRE-family HTH domain